MSSASVRFDLLARDGASRTFDKVGAKMGVLEKASNKLGNALKVGLLAGSAALAGIGVVSVKSAVSFQSAMTKISTQAGGTRKDIKVLSDQVLSLGGKVQQGPQQLAQALYHLKSVGMDNVDAMKALRTASDLAAVGGSDLEETTNALAGAWRTGIKGATSFGQAAATVNSIIGAGNMTMEQFTEALSSGILPTAKTFGLTLSQVGSALALFTDEGVPASDAATRLRMSISLLGAPSGAAEKQLKKIGLTGLDLAKAMRGPDGIIGAVQLLKDHLDASGMSAAEQSQILSRAFGGGKSSSGIMALVNNLDVLKKKQDQVNSSTGKYADAVAQQRQTAEAEWKRLESALQSGSVRLGTALLPPLTSFVGYLNDRVIPAAEKVGSHLGNFLPMAKIKADFADAQGVIGDFLKGLTGISSAPAQKLATPQLKAPTVPKFLARPESDAQKFGDTVQKVGVQLGKDLKPLAESAVGISKAFATIAIKTPAPVFTTIVDVMIATAITKRVIGLGVAFKGLAVAMGETWAAATGPLGLAAVGVWGLATAFSAASGHGTSLGATLSFLKAAIVGPYGVVGAVKSIGDAFVWVFSPNGGLAQHIGDFNHWLSAKGHQVVNGFVQGVKDQWHSFTGWFTGTMPNELIAWVESGFGIASPAKKMMPVGANVIRGFLVGALGVASSIGGWLTDHVVNPVKSRFSGAGGWLVSKGSSLLSGFESGAYSLAKGVGGWFTSHVRNPAVGAFSGSGSWLYGKGRALLNGLLDGMQQPWGALTKWVSGIAGWIKAHKGPISLDRKLLVPAGKALMSGLLSGLKFGFGPVGDFVYSIGDTVSGTVSKITSLLGFGGGGGGAVSRWSGLVAQVLSMLGAPAYAQGAVLKRIEIESGGNPNAINLTDSNARAGHPSQGLMQTIPSTFAAFAGPYRSRGITDPLASIYAGVNYAMHRYGANWINVMTRPGGYAKGTGGAAKGWAWVGEQGPELINLKGGETILSHPQSMAAAQVYGIRLPGYASGTISPAMDRVRRDRQAVEDAKDAVSRAKRRRKGEAAAEKRLKAAEKELQAAEIALKNANRTGKVAVSNLLTTSFVKTLSTGTASSIASAIKSLSGKLITGGFEKSASYVLRTGSKLESLASRRDSIQSTIAAANQYATDQASGITDFLKFSGTSATSVGALISQISGQQRTASDFVSLTRLLRARGASTGLLQQLSDAGPGSQLAAILGDRSVTTSDIAKLNSLVANGGKLATSFGRDMADALYDSGKDAGKGFLTGLQSQEKALESEITKLANSMVTAIKKALKIKSPSQVMRDQVGKQIALGMVVGMDRHRPHVAAAGRRLAATAYASTSAAASSARANAAFNQLAQLINSGKLGGGTEVHVHFDDPSLRDLIRVTTKPMIQNSEGQQAYRAKVGRR